MPGPTYFAPFSPSSELTAVGFAKENSFGGGIPSSPTAWLICDDVSLTPTNELLERPGNKQHIGRTPQVPGLFTAKGSLSCEADPDIVEALLMAAFGLDSLADSGFGTASQPNFQAAIANPASNGSVSTTLAAALNYGSNNAKVASATGIAANSLLKIDTAAKIENVQVMAVSGTLFAAEFLKAHNNGVAVVSSTVTNAHLRALQLSSPRPSFALQVFRVTDLVNIVGCKMSQLSFAVSPKSILSCKAQFEYQDETSTQGYDPYDATPTYPTAPSVSYSTLYPFTFEQAGNSFTINGSQSTATVMSWTLDLNTGLIADYPNFGGGRFRNFYPEQQSKASGSMVLGFEDQVQMRNFWGNAQAQSPQTIILPIVLIGSFVQPWYINSAYQYTLQFVMGSCKISALSVPIKNGDYLKQNVKFECAESTPGANDDILGFLINTNGSSSNTGGF